jgi:hypothetical protein
MSHSRWKTLRERKLAEGFTKPEDVAEARREIRPSMALAKAVYDRRTELGLTQTWPTARASPRRRSPGSKAPTPSLRCRSWPSWLRLWTRP